MESHGEPTGFHKHGWLLVLAKTIGITEWQLCVALPGASSPQQRGLREQAWGKGVD